MKSPPDWRAIMRTNITSVTHACKLLNIDKSQLIEQPNFVLNLPLRLFRKIRSLDDPLGRQFLPLTKEAQNVAGFIADPIAEEGKRQGRLIQKFQRRALLITTSACAMHCRYCFRQHMGPSEEDLSKTLDRIAADKTLEEVILSGGDPLSLSDAALSNIIARLNTLEHIRLLRFHTRFILGIPERITPELLALLQTAKAQVIFVIHTNHVRELDKDIFCALQKIQRLGIPVLSQSVLLKGVNDNTQTLEELYLTLVRHGVIPYYLHQLDRVQGAAHFEVPKEQGLALIRKLNNSLPGYAVPRYVQELPGETRKTPVVLQ